MVNRKDDLNYGQDMQQAFRRLNRNVKRRTGNMSPGACERGRGMTLRTICDNNGMRASDLAMLLDIRPPSLTEKLRKLEADGLIYRQQDRKDGRIVRVYITELGKEALTEKNDGLKQLNDDFAEILSDEEQKLFCEICHRLSDHLEMKCRQYMADKHDKVVQMAKKSKVYIGDETACLHNDKKIGS